MANAKFIEQKAAKVAEIQAKIDRGITVAEDTELRRSMRKENVEYIVLKNNMVSRAAENASIDSKIEDMLKGPVAYAFGYDDDVAPARILKAFVKKAKKCELKGGIVDGKLTSAADMDAIADLPSKEVLISRLLGSMKSPISKLAIVLDQIAKQKGEAPEA